MPTAKIVLKVKIEQADADGSRCIACGDIMFLRAFKLVAYCGERNIGHGSGRLCGACGEAIAAHLVRPEAKRKDAA